ncbi:MAG: chemotaxis protein [Fusobacterium sp.]|uniref:chemotaxis protein n=1 Tax=Fusobacterium sp. TaxID=68766 RepID=UPI0026DDC0D6|nr:chemotaxis protein [Fusobacterium sp.]MDO4690883.1 chemotaxis protein [Fusobacterium sp.]
MEIYIDNEKIELGKKNRKNFERIIKVITKKLEQNEKIISNIYINGALLEESTIINIEDLNLLEVETKSYVDLVIESLAYCRSYIEVFFEILFFINLKLENSEKLLKDDIAELHSFLIWFVDLINLMEETYDFNIYINFKEILDSLDENIKILIEKRKKKNYIDYLNILELKIAPILEVFYKDINFYYDRIIEEEKKKRFVS